MKKEYLILAGIGAAIYFLSKNKKQEVEGIGYLENYHAIFIDYLGATNTRGSKVSLKSYRFKDSILLDWNYRYDRVLDLVEEFFEKRGIKIIGSAESKTGYVILIDKFLSLKEIKKM